MVDVEITGSGRGGIPNSLDPNDPNDPSTGATTSPRLNALRQRQAELEALLEGKPGRAIGGSGSGFRYAVKYHYGATGLLDKVTEAEDPSALIWQAQSRDPFGHVGQALLGNSVTVNETLDSATGRISHIHSSSTPAGTLQLLSYQSDAAGNLRSRQDTLNDLTENMIEYDALNRLKVTQVDDGPILSLDYDAVGNTRHRTGPSARHEPGAERRSPRVARRAGSGAARGPGADGEPAAVIRPTGDVRIHL